jgi:PAS domain S-box-containing protein
MDEILSKALDEVCAFVDSPIGFYHFMESDGKALSLQQWSTRTLNEFCRAEGKGLHYGVDQAGVWVDCVREKKPVIHNDYASLKHKKGMPEGHARVVRELVAPVMRGGKVVAILGVGNKQADYTERDAETVAFLADVTWEIVERKKAEEMRRESAEINSAIVNQATESIVLIDPETLRFIEFNDATCRGLGYSREEFAQLTLLDIQGILTGAEVFKRTRKILEAGHALFENKHRLKDGALRDVLVSNRVICERNRKYIVGLWRDITEQKRVEEIITESERKYRTLFETANDGIFLQNEKYFLDCNQKCQEMYRLSKEDIIGRSPVELSPQYQPDGRPSAEAAAEKIAAALGGAPQYFEWQALRSDGVTFDVEINLNRVDSGGSVLLHAVIRDISRRKNAEKALRASEERLADIIDFLPDATFAINSEGTVIAWNRAIEEMTGVPKAAMLGKGNLEYALPFYGARRRLLIDLVFASPEEIERDYHSVSKVGNTIVAETFVPGTYGGKGAELWGTAAAICDRSGKISAAIESIRDVTDRKQAEDKLKKAEAKYRAIFENALEGIFQSTPEGRYIAANPAHAKMLGFDSPEELLESTMDIRLQRYADSSERTEFMSLLTRNDCIKDFRVQLLRKDGSKIWVTIDCVAIRDSDGNIVYFQGTMLDITDRLRAEEALQESRQQLVNIIDFLPDATFVIDREGKVIAWNRAMEEMSGIGAANMLGKGAYEYARPFYGQRRPILIDLIDVGDDELGSKYDNIWKRHGMLYTEKYVPNVYEGAGAYLFATAAPLFDAHGNRSGAIESIRDITEQKRSQEALRRSEEKYRELVENANSIILRMDSAGRVTFINEFAQRFFGYRDEEILGKNVVGTIAPEVGSSTGHDLKLMVENIGLNPACYASSINENMRRNGERVWIAWTNKPIFDESGRIVEILCVGNDVTERKQVEEDLKRSEERLKTLFEYAPDPYYLTDVEGNIVDGNVAAEKMTGYAKKDLIGKNLLEIDLLPSEEKPRARELLAHSAAGISTGPTEFTLKQKDGTTVYLENRSYPTVIGGKTLLLGIARDITARKLAEGDLKESQRQLAGIIDFLPDATFVIDGEGKVIAWNRAMEEMTGVVAADILGKGDYEYAFPFYGARRPILIDLVINSREEMEKEYVALERKGGVLSGEAYMPALKGGGTYLYGKATALFDSKGHVVGAIESIRDLTERRLMEEAVALAEKKYRDIFENSVTGIYQVTVDGRFLKVNTAIAHLYGYDTPDEFLNAVGNAWDLYVHPDSRAEMFRLIEKHGLVKEFEVQLFKKNKSVAWASLNVRTVFDNDGKIAYLEGTALDITDSKLLKAQLEQAQKMESVGRLAGGVAHDFNNMLGVITGRAELALLRDVSPEVRNNLEEILKAGHRSADLTRQLLAFARKQTASPKILDLNDTISGMFKMLQRLIREEIDLSWIPAVNLWEVKIDPSQVDQILANLVVNAGDAITGSGRITIMTENVVIDDSKKAERPEFIAGDYVLLTVIDTGAGMSKEVSEKIFDPFFTTKEVGKGTGLGLSTVYGIVKQNEGFIYVESQQGKGAIFRIYLRRFKTEAVQPQIKDVDGGPRGGTETILLVEDDEAVLNLSRMLLESLGYTVLVAHTSLHATQLAREHKSDLHLLITDVVMPEMNGRELVERIRSFMPGLKCLFMSGYTADVITHKGVLDEGVNFIQKPFNIADLAKKVRQILDGLE